MIMTHQGAAAAINPRPTEAEVLEALRYNLCRCGAHIEIMRAAMRAAGHARRGAGLMAAEHPAADRCRSLVASASADEGAFETFIRITADGTVTAFNGHVDLGTGIRTALGQIVAEELDVSFARVVVVLGDTSRVPNQGATIASETIQITAVPLRKAAAQARHFLLARAAERLELAGRAISTIEDGLIRGRDNRSVSYGELIAGETIRLELADDVPVKAVDAYTHRRAVGAARRSSGQGHRRTGLCARRARARHAAWPRGAPALCRRRCRRFRRHQPDRGR